MALGTSLSAFWILSANSWMQTPAGHEVRDGIAYPVDWLADHLQSELPVPLRPHVHGGLSDDALVVLAVGARYLVAGALPAKKPKTMMRMGLGMVAVLAPLQLFIGDQHGLNTAEVSAGQGRRHGGHWDGTQARRRSSCSPWPDADERDATDFEIAIPNLGEPDPHPRARTACSRA